MLKHIDPSIGTFLAYNTSFEKTRIKELAEMFPEYKTKLLAINEIAFDLMDIVKGSSRLYESLGYSKEEAAGINFYHPKLNGSYSIKKVLPIFTNLSYKNMEIGNGVEALVAYSKFSLIGEEEKQKIRRELFYYCGQDTWAMVAILDNLRKLAEKRKQM